MVALEIEIATTVDERRGNLCAGPSRSVAFVAAQGGAPRGPRPCAADQWVGRNLRRRRLLLTTNTEENAIAAPASIGLSRPAMASGIIATL